MKSLNKFHDQLPYYGSLGKTHENGSLNDNRYGYGWFEENQLTNVAMIRHSPSGAGKLNYLQHDKLNAPVSAAQIAAEQAGGKSSKRDNENIFQIIVPVTIGIVIAVTLFSLINYLKKMPDIPDLTDQCLIVQQIKLSELKTNRSAPSEEEEPSPQNLITNPFEHIDEILNSTVKLAKAPSLSHPANQAISHSNTIAQLNEIYHPVVKGPHTHSHLLIKPSYSTVIPSSVLAAPAVQKETNYLNDDMNCESRQSRHNHGINLSTFYLNNKAQLDYEHNTFATQNWPVNCCETCPCNQQTHPHRAPD